jgi:hypothetical protein
MNRFKNEQEKLICQNKNDKKIEGRGEEKPSSTKTRMRTSKGIRMDSLYGVHIC